MSTRIMAVCWPLDIPPTPKFVLIALADNANDAGFCWPSIDTICERTSFGRTAVIDAIRWLESNGLLVANRTSGRKTTYTITASNQSASRTGEQAQTSTADGPVSDDKPVRQADPSGRRTRPADGPNQSASRTGPVRQADTNRHITVKEPSKTRDKSRIAERPAAVPESVWLDFLAIRKEKRSPLTETALKGIASQAERAGLSLTEALEVCCRQGWQGFNVNWYANLTAESNAAKRSVQPTKEPWAGAI